MSKTRSLRMKGLSLLVVLAMAVAALPLVATPALAAGDEPLPDLVVSEVTTEWVVEGETYTITFTIKNEGDALAAESTASIVIDGTEAATADIPALAPDATHTATVPLPPGYFTLTEGEDTIEVVADSLGVVTEGNEGNNSKETTLLGMPDLVVTDVDFDWIRSIQYLWERATSGTW
ncbi:hypothetical protein M1O24_00100 [Dehalococcoidia bacterium]|nr:hypothetical protein [Dehalococcoidia bacterium]